MPHAFPVRYVLFYTFWALTLKGASQYHMKYSDG